MQSRRNGLTKCWSWPGGTQALAPRVDRHRGQSLRRCSRSATSPPPQGGRLVCPFQRGRLGMQPTGLLWGDIRLGLLGQRRHRLVARWLPQHHTGCDNPPLELQDMACLLATAPVPGPRCHWCLRRTLCALSKRNSSLATGPGCCVSCKSCNCIRAAVSLKKRRFVRAGFDMDLSYITDRIIAMGFPSRGCESCYRNSAASTHDFMAQRHPGRFRIWNLCCEAGRSYSKDLFMGSVVEIGFLDHNAPRMEQVEEFCRGVDEWLAAHPDNVAAVHCKAGKVSCHAGPPPSICEPPMLLVLMGARGLGSSARHV